MMKWLKDLTAEQLALVAMIFILGVVSANACYESYLKNQIQNRILDCVIKTGYPDKCKAVLSK
jgi:hypothetical protein